MSTLAIQLNDDEATQEQQDVDAMFYRLDASRLTKGVSTLYLFVQNSWSIVEPGVPFTPNWHIKVMCDELERCYYRKTRRKIFNVPPGTAKSLIVNVFFPAWVWAKDARKRFLFASYGAHLTTRDNLRCRQLIQHEWFQQRWPVQMNEAQDAKTRYNTTKGGWRIATSVNGVGTGEHPDFIIIDDPTSAQEADSDTARTNANDWFDRTMSSRLGRDPVFIVIMQRLHMDDLTGHLTTRGGWDISRWPMRYEKCTCPPNATEELHCVLHKADPTWSPDRLDPRTLPGELLFPALFPNEKVTLLELDLGPYGAAGQLQQRPAPEGGGLFKREWFKFLDVLPRSVSRRARGWDTASTEQGGDYTVGVKIAETHDGTFIIEDVQRDQLSPNGVDRLIHSVANTDGRRCPVREEKEGGSAGKTVVDARAKLLKGFDYQAVIVSGSKATRAKPFRSQVEAGNVFVLRAAWNNAYIKELCDFRPNGSAHDDQVDATSCAFNAVLLEPKRRRVSTTWGAGV